MRLRAAIATVLFAACVAPSALANGRYPSAQQFLVDPDDSNRVWLRATYGLVTTANGGSSWDWVCEGAVGYDSREDPMLVVAHQGKVFAGAFAGLTVTTDNGCNWTRDDAIGDTYVRDVAADKGGDHVFAITSTATREGDYELGVWRSDGEPPVFTSLGPPIARDVLGFTLDVAPSDANRLYVSGAVWPLSPSALTVKDAGLPPQDLDASPRGPNGPAAFFRSRDGGKTWERRRLLGASLYSNPYIAAVHPTNPDIMYVRVRGVSTGQGYIESHLLYSEDAGDSFREVFRAPADMLGFALAPDGEHVYVGLGDSRDLSGQRKVDPSSLGIYEANATDLEFTRVFTGQISCLTYSGDTLFACGAQVDTGFEVAASKDAGRTFSKLLGFGEIRGALQCPSTSGVAQECTVAWPLICDPIGVCPTGKPTPDAGTPDAGATAMPLPSSDDSGCSTGHGSRTLAGPAVVLAVLGALAHAVRRRRHS